MTDSTRDKSPAPARTRKAKPKPAPDKAEPRLLSGGNPQIAKGYGEAPVQAYLAAMPGWKSDIGRRLDALIGQTVPNVTKAVKWNSPFYGIEGQGWFLGIHCFTNYVKVTFFRGASLAPLPPGASKQKDVRHLDIREDAPFDEAQFIDWVRQASGLPGERMKAIAMIGRKIDLSLFAIAERIIGFTIPDRGIFYVLDHDNVWRIIIDQNPIIEKTDYNPYEFADGRIRFLGSPLNNIKSNEPILRVGQHKIDYKFDNKADFVSVIYKIADRQGKFEFKAFSGDWFAATFSDDGRYLILADPYELELYEVA